MVDADRTALCVLCPPHPDRPARPAEVGNACPACAGRLTNTILEIRRLDVDLAAQPTERDARRGPIFDAWGRAVHHRGTAVLRPRDPVAAALPAGPTTAAADGPHITGTAEAHLPVPVDRLDLDVDAATHVTEPLVPLVVTWRDPNPKTRIPVVFASRIVWVARWHRSLARHPGGTPILVPLGDQTGELPPRVLLEQWVIEWRAQRGWRPTGDEIHAHDVDAYTTWLLARLDWALTHHPALADFATEMRALAGRMRAAAGQTEPGPDRARFAGVQCRNDHCDARGTLYQVPGDDWIECGACGLIYTEAEYEEWAGRLAAHAATRHRRRP